MGKSTLIAVDAGKDSVKAVRLDREVDSGLLTEFSVDNILNNLTKVTFPTKLHELPEGYSVDVEGSSYVVRFEGKNYVVGEQGSSSDFSLSKESLHHRLGMYTAIALLCDEDIVEITLAIGCPASIYANSESRNEFRDKVMNNGEVSINVDGRDIVILIKDVLIYPEGSGVIFRDAENLMGERVAVVDLGGLNMNFVEHNANLVPILETTLTTNDGYTRLMNEVRRGFNSRYGQSFSDTELSDFIKRGNIYTRGELDVQSAFYLKDLKSKYLSRILNQISSTGANIDHMSVVFAGGTSQLISKEIMKAVPHAVIVSNPIWANVEGFFLMGVLDVTQEG